MTSALHVVPYGDDALLVELADLAAVRRLDDAVRHAREAPDPSVWGAVVDQVPAATTVLLRTAPGADLTALAAQVRRVWRSARTADPADDTEPAGGPGRRGPDPVVELPVRYDGDDLAEVAALTGLTVGEVVQRHAGATYTVAFGGFMPGFAYLVGLDPALRVPRRATPRERVPAGAVAIADEFAAVYPAATPGGWRLLGRCDVPLFDVARTPPALLAPGSRVRFVPEPEQSPGPGPSPEPQPGQEPEPGPGQEPEPGPRPEPEPGPRPEPEPGREPEPEPGPGRGREPRPVATSGPAAAPAGARQGAT